MQRNKRNIGDIVYKPNPITPLNVMRCLITGVVLANEALSIEGKLLDDLDRNGSWNILYHVVQELNPKFINGTLYPEHSLFATKEEALEYVINQAKEVLDIPIDNETPDNG